MSDLPKIGCIYKNRRNKPSSAFLVLGIDGPYQPSVTRVRGVLLFDSGISDLISFSLQNFRVGFPVLAFDMWRK